MNTHRIATAITATTLALGLAACGELPATDNDSDELPGAGASSPAAIDIERAGRLLERGGSPAEARRLLEGALGRDDISASERDRALLELSRAHQAAGELDAAASLIEHELSAHRDDAGWAKRPFRERLRELLGAAPEAPHNEAHRRDLAPPFAHLLGKYFPFARGGRVQVRTILVGGDSSVTNEIGTFNVSAGARAAFEEACPLCRYDADVHSSVWRGDWTIFAEAGDRLEQALLVIYFDLEGDRVPARYQRYLPLAIDDIVTELERGKSFFVARERDGAPPTVLIAAPRAAMLADVERELARQSELPRAVHQVKVDTKMRSEEIRRVVRTRWFDDVRRCYDALLTRDAKAGGKVVAELTVDGQGHVTRAQMRTDDRPLRGDSFLQCMTGSAEHLTFPAIGEGHTTIRYPVELTPE